MRSSTAVSRFREKRLSANPILPLFLPVFIRVSRIWLHKDSNGYYDASFLNCLFFNEGHLPLRQIFQPLLSKYEMVALLHVRNW